MNANQIERAAYIAAHEIFTANTSAPELACAGARRTYAVDTIAAIIKSVFELHCRELSGLGIHAVTADDSTPIVRSACNEKILPFRTEAAVQSMRTIDGARWRRAAQEEISTDVRYAVLSLPGAEP